MIKLLKYFFKIETFNYNKLMKNIIDYNFDKII